MSSIARSIAVGTPLAILCTCGGAVAADLASDCKQIAAQGFLPKTFQEVGQADLVGVGDVFSFSDGPCLCQATFEDVPRTRREALALARANPKRSSSLYCEVN